MLEAGFRVMQQWLTVHDPGAGIPLVYIPTADGVVLKGTLNEVMERGELADVPCILGSCKNDVGVSPESAKKNLRDGSLYQITQGFAHLQHTKGKISPCYLYYFMHDLPGDSSGAPHCSDGNYIFHVLDKSSRPFTEADRALSDEMAERWISFAKTGVPDCKGKMCWQPYAAGQKNVMDFV